jgi:hypothetical protein
VLVLVVGWMVLRLLMIIVRVGTVERLIVLGKFRVRLMVMIVMHVGAVGRLIVPRILIVRGRLPRLCRLWVLVELWLVERAHV